MAKQDTFRELREKIHKFVEDRKYADAEGEIKKELLPLAGMLGGDPGEQFRKLRAEFEATLGPEIREFINPEGPELRGRAAKARAAQIERIQKLSAKEEAWENSGEEFGGNVAENPRESTGATNNEVAESKFLEKPSWDIPVMDEIRPGLILTVSSLRGKTAADREEKPGVRGWHMEYYEVVTRPIFDGDKDPLIEVIDMSTGKTVDKKLAEFGILPYKENGMWNAEQHIVGWIMKAGEEGRGGKKRKAEGKSEE